MAFIFLLIISSNEMNGQTTMNNNQTLNAKEQSIVTISAFTAKGDLENLQKALNRGLDSGLTVNEIKEVLVQMYAYCGFPRSLNGGQQQRDQHADDGDHHQQLHQGETA